MFDEFDKKKFNKLLNWLDSDRDKAALQYEHIRRALIKIFVARGFSNAEDLADETIDRVIIKIETIEASYQGAKIRYFLGVAKYLIKETNKSREVQAYDLPFLEEVKDQNSVAYEKIAKQTSDNQKECLAKCLTIINKKQKNLILKYYDVNKSNKVLRHKKLSEKKLASDNALRNQIHRIKNKLKKCCEKCMNEKKT